MLRWFEGACFTALVSLTAVYAIRGHSYQASSQTVGDDQSRFAGSQFQENVRTTTARTPEEERRGFKLPPGFEIQLFASDPDIGKPMNIAFDGKGRLWVTQSHEYPFAAAASAGKDRITILEDTDGDGKADGFIDFRDDLNIPIGVLPYKHGAIAYSIPNISRFSDANGDGKADSRTQLFGPFQFVDTHGMVNSFVRGFDGWVHACHGFTNDSTVRGSDGHSVRLVSGNTFRFHPDGSRVEHTTYGRINPFGLVYDALGYLYSTDCHSAPLYQLIRGADYPQFGKEPGMGFAPMLKPREDEATALAGIAYYADELFPPAYQKSFYIGDVVKSRIYRSSFEMRGSSPVGKREPDFLLSEDSWFRPVDIKLGPDGAIYVADFYNRIIGHYEVSLTHPGRDKVRGRIWRITYRGQTNQNRDLTTASAAELIKVLKEKNLPLRMLAADELADRIGKDAVAPVNRELNRKDVDAQTYSHGLWVLHRLDALDNALILKSARHPDEMVRLHTLRILAEREDPKQTFHTVVLRALEDENPHVGRAAVEALAHYPGMATVATLLKQRHRTPDSDTHLVYTQRLALRNLLADERLLKDVVARKWGVEDAVVLSGVMPGINMPEAGAFLLAYLGDSRVVADEQLPRMFQHAAKFIPDGRMSALLQAAKQRSGNDLNREFTIASAIRKGIVRRQGNVNREFIEWGSQLASAIMKKHCATGVARPAESLGQRNAQSHEVEQQMLAIEMAGDYQITALEPHVSSCLDNAASQQVKVAAVKALLQIAPEKNSGKVREIVQHESDPRLRQQVIIALGDMSGSVTRGILDSIDVDSLSLSLKREVARALAATPEGKTIVFQRVREGKIPPQTLLEPRAAERILLNISAEQRKEYERLTSNLATPAEERERMIWDRLAKFKQAAGSPNLAEAGQAVFVRHCLACHQVKGTGGRIGPELDGVGNWGATALAEKVLDPNRNISQAFKMYTVTTKDNKVLSGLFRRDEGASLIFADITGNEFSVPKDNIAEQKAAQFTLMPDQFATLPQDDFNALLAYLLALKD